MKPLYQTSPLAWLRKLRPLRAFADLSLQTKLIIVFVTLTVLSILSIGMFNARYATTALYDQVGNMLNKEAVTQAQGVGDLLMRQVNTLQAFGLTKFVQEQVSGANSAYQGDTAGIMSRLQELDLQWLEADDFDPMIQSRLRNQLAIELRKYSAAFPDNVELVITDRFGATIAASSRTSDYLQSDEEWWQAAWNNGNGAMYISQPTFDESSKTFALILAVPIHSSIDNSVIGVLQSTYRLDTLINLIVNQRIGETGRMQLLLPDNTLLSEALNVTSLDANSAALLEAPTGTSIEAIYQGVRRFVSQAPIVSGTDDTLISSLGWRLLVYQDLEESLYPSNMARRLNMMVTFGGAFVAVVIAVLVARSINAPLGHLARISEKIAQGDLSQRANLTQRDEIGLLAQHFDIMADMLAARQAEQEQTYSALVKHHEEQQRLLELISDLETPLLPLGRGVLLAPLVGSLDQRRTEAARSRILEEISRQRADWVILDLTGVVLTNQGIIKQLVEIGQGVQLLGAQMIFTGINAEMAIMLAEHHIELRGFKSVATLEAAIETVMQAAKRSKSTVAAHQFETALKD